MLEVNMADNLVTTWDGVKTRADTIGFPIKILGPHGPIGLGKFATETTLLKSEQRIRDILEKQKSDRKGLLVLKCNY